ncbi:MAG TPA: hypothetical protein VKU01_13825 [Bryobacteraceae bacterium]|nr:hypothetical protein [Bryobacteraceae bacterium]
MNSFDALLRTPISSLGSSTTGNSSAQPTTGSTSNSSQFVIQYQSYLSQARSTEVVARANYLKAKAALDRVWEPAWNPRG